MRKDLLPYYRALGLSPGAEPLEIRRAYRQLVQQWHPDLYKPGSPMQTTAEDITKEVNEAYEQLYRRKRYRSFASKPAPGSAGKAKPAGGSHGSAESAKPGAARRGPPRSARRPRRTAASLLDGYLGKAVAWSRLRRVRAVASAGVLLAAVMALRSGLENLSRPGVGAPANAASSLPAAAAAAPPARLASAAAGAPAASRETAGSSLGPAAIEGGSAMPRTREGDALLDRAGTLLDVIEVGDTRARVLALQGTPDEAADTVIRYGSSVVFFSNGLVRGWLDRQPRLHVRHWDEDAPAQVDTFTMGSTRGDVVRAQGLPSAFTASSYLYGLSVVNFEAGRVASWSEGDVGLRHFEMPTLPFLDIESLERGRAE